MSEEIRMSFEAYIVAKGFDITMDFFGENENPYFNDDTKLAYEIWCEAIKTREES